MRVINVYVDHVWAPEDDTNIPKENVPPPLPDSYPKIYPISVPKIISYASTSHFIIVFFDVVHV